MQNKISSPLEGIRVIEFTTAWVGPGCGMILSEMGAEVIRLDNPALPDLHRRIGPFAEGKHGLNRAAWCAVWNRGKKDCLLDLKKPENVEIAKRVVKMSDVVITNFAPRVMGSLGLSYDVLKEVKPDIIMVTASGYGDSGPDRDCVAYGAVLEAYAGLNAVMGSASDPYMGCGIPISDHIAATLSAFAIIAALHRREITGEGQYIDLSEVEAMITCMPEAFMEYTMNGKLPPRRGNRDDMMAPHGCYRCKGDDKWIAIAIGSDAEFKELCLAMHKPELVTDPRFVDVKSRLKHQDELDIIIKGWSITQNVSGITEQLRKKGIACGPVYNSEELYNDPQLRSRGFFIAFDHPEVGKRELPGVIARLSKTPAVIKTREPLCGEHTDWVLNELLKQGK